jgi:hypothetical protein
MKARIADRLAVVRARIDAEQKKDNVPECGTEPHYTPEEIAKMWKLAPNTIRSIFENRPGVLKVGSSAGDRARRYTKLRVPKSIVDKAHSELAR